MATKYASENTILYLWSKIKTMFATKDAATQESAGLMTAADKTKLAGIATGANNYTLPAATLTTLGGVIVGGDFAVGSDGTITLRSDLTLPEGAEVETSPPTGNSSTMVATTAFVSDAVSNALSGITGISLQTVTSLPSSGKSGVIYLLSNGGSSPNRYDEYIWTGSAFEKIGSTAVDLTGYWAKADLVALTNAEIDAICV